MEHITQGVNRALDNCGPGNILREVAKRVDQKEIEKLETEKAQLAAQVAAMTQELSQKSEEIRKYLAEQTVVVSRIRELVGHPGEVVNKAHLYDRMMESAGPSSTGQTLPILVKYSRMMKDLLVEFRRWSLRAAPPGGYSIRVHPDRQPERCMRWSAKWRWCRLLRRGPDPANRAEPPSLRVPEGFRIGKGPVLQKGPAFPRFAGRAPGRFNPKKVGPLLQGGHLTDPGRRIGPGPP